MNSNSMFNTAFDRVIGHGGKFQNMGSNPITVGNSLKERLNSCH